jgi:hypothetical protein
MSSGPHEQVTPGHGHHSCQPADPFAGTSSPRPSGNNVSQQVASALGIAVVSTFVATATNDHVDHHGSTAVVSAPVHGFTVGYWWAVGVFWAGAVSCGALIRGGTRFH